MTYEEIDERYRDAVLSTGGEAAWEAEPPFDEADREDADRE